MSSHQFPPGYLGMFQKIAAHGGEHMSVFLLLFPSLPISGRPCGKSSDSQRILLPFTCKVGIILSPSILTVQVLLKGPQISQHQSRKAFLIIGYISFILPWRSLRPREVRGLVQNHTARDEVLESSFSSSSVQSLSRVQLFETPWTVACHAPLSIEFFRHQYWSELPFLSPGDLPDPGIEPRSPALQVDSLPSEPPGKP